MSDGNIRRRGEQRSEKGERPLLLSKPPPLSPRTPLHITTNQLCVLLSTHVCPHPRKSPFLTPRNLFSDILSHHHQVPPPLLLPGYLSTRSASPCPAKPLTPFSPLPPTPLGGIATEMRPTVRVNISLTLRLDMSKPDALLSPQLKESFSASNPMHPPPPLPAHK